MAGDADRHRRGRDRSGGARGGAVDPSRSARSLRALARRRGALAGLVVVAAAWASSGDHGRPRGGARLGGVEHPLRRPAPRRPAFGSPGSRTTTGSASPPDDGRADRSTAPSARTTGGRPRSTSSPTTTGSRTSPGSPGSRVTSGRSSRGAPDAGRGATGNWLEQEIEIRALVDDRLAAAGTPVALDSVSSAPFSCSRRWRAPHARAARRGLRYRVWSYAPDPAPAVLVRSKPRYPGGRGPLPRAREPLVPAFGAPGREAVARSSSTTPRTRGSRSTAAVHDGAAGRGHGRARRTRRCRARGWFRHGGGVHLRRASRPGSGPPLVAFVTRTKAGYCQHYAGGDDADAADARHPRAGRVGFERLPGRRRWVVTDHDAHAWVEAWFAGIGWIPFDPTRAGGPSAVTTRSRPTRWRRARSDRGELTQRRVGDDLPDTAGLSTVQVPPRAERAPSFAAAPSCWVRSGSPRGRGRKAIVRRAR